MQLLLRFEDLRTQGLVQTWTTLNRWIDELGFPPGRIIGRNRVWTEAEVSEWIEGRPSAKLPLKGRAKDLVEGMQQ
jgi:predicted DNA-binding transcriptional regulator AlpA